MGEINVPKSLLPENIMATVEGKIKREKRKRRRRKIAIISSFSVAAAVVLIAGIYFRFFNKKFGEEEEGIAGLNRIKSYQALYNYLRTENIIINEVPKGDASSSGTEMDMLPEGNMGNGDYSETNIQTKGIDEGDIVKTDGEYIYVTSGKKTVVVLKADGGDTKKVSDIDIRRKVLKKYNNDNKINKDSFKIIDTYIYKDRLTVISSCAGEKGMVYVAVVQMNEGKAGDIHITRQEGEYYDSRMKDGILYLITHMNMSADLLNSVDDVIGTAGDKEIPPENAFYTSIHEYYNMYYIMSSVDILSEAEIVDSKTYIGGSIELYVSYGHIYFLEEDNYGEKINIVSFSFEDGRIEPEKSGYVYGIVNDSFSADEYNGYLRVVTTQASGNSLYVLNDKLEIVGSITGIAKGEEIKSARFMGDMGYFVTYRNTDPLFMVDLSNPEEPRIMDELKITGYSAYLHFLDDDNLLGIGFESDSDTGIEEGVKVTLFDVSDKSDIRVKENFKYGKGTYSDAINNHNAIMASDSKGIYGFCLYYYEFDTFVNEGGNGNGVYARFEPLYKYKVFMYKDGAIREVESIEKYDENNVRYTVRGLYIGDYFYLVSRANAYVYSLDDVAGEEKAVELVSISY